MTQSHFIASTAISMNIPNRLLSATECFPYGLSNWISAVTTPPPSLSLSLSLSLLLIMHKNGSFITEFQHTSIRSKF